jgi:hypothetical protein
MCSSYPREAEAVLGVGVLVATAEALVFVGAEVRVLLYEREGGVAGVF